MAAPTIIVDLSHHNPTPNWAALKAGGIVGVILKATEGTSYVDPTFAQRRIDAEAAGLIVSSYHFYHGNASAEMNHYLTTVVPRTGERLVIDHEDSAASLKSLEDAVKYLRNAVPDCEITVYSGHLIKDQLGSKTSPVLAENTSLWIAQYTSAAAPSWPKQVWPAWSLWQFTDKATVPGISAPVDGNRFNGSAENAKKWLGRASGMEPEPAPEPETGMVTVAIEVPPGIEISVVVNGKLIA
jgi:GH25 family lysozyme M1 (1,4-beta-N-acetylmuramidase)